MQFSLRRIFVVFFFAAITLSLCKVLGVPNFGIVMGAISDDASFLQATDMEAVSMVITFLLVVLVTLVVGVYTLIGLGYVWNWTIGALWRWSQLPEDEVIIGQAQDHCLRQSFDWEFTR